MPRRRTANPAAIFQVKVTLGTFEPEIWRRLLVPADITLDQLHVVVNEVMGWTDSHLHRFQLRDRSFGDTQAPDAGELHLEDERKFNFSSLVGVGQLLTYEYDFGDGWDHEVMVEKVLDVDRRHAYPLCVGGARACPPEDCGGPPGYENLLAALKDTDHDQHDELVAWVGGHFDPEGFDMNRTNRALRERGR